LSPQQPQASPNFGTTTIKLNTYKIESESQLLQFIKAQNIRTKPRVNEDKDKPQKKAKYLGHV